MAIKLSLLCGIMQNGGLIPEMMVLPETESGHEIIDN
jgi:hypothetical protein